MLDWRGISSQLFTLQDINQPFFISGECDGFEVDLGSIRDFLAITVSHSGPDSWGFGSIEINFDQIKIFKTAQIMLTDGQSVTVEGTRLRASI